MLTPRRLQSLVSRETSPLESSVVSVTQLGGGDAHNVIPNDATLGGTFRSLSLAGTQHLRERIESVMQSTAAAYQCTAEVDFLESEHPVYPPTVNDGATYQFARGVAAGVLGADKWVEDEPTMCVHAACRRRRPSSCR